MKIAVFGDSFAHVHEYMHKPNKKNINPATLWVNYIRDALNVTVDNYAHPGTSIWYSYELLTKNWMHYYDTVIFTYTHYQRLNGLPEHLKDYSNLNYAPNNDDNSTHVELLKKVHPLVFSEPLQYFIYENVFYSVNKLCKENNLKLINLFPFETVNQEWRKLNLDYATGSCLLGLKQVSDNEMPWSKVLQPDMRGAHLNDYNNKVLADIILETLASPVPVIKDLLEDARFQKYKDIKL
jgi:hypothetical protein